MDIMNIKKEVSHIINRELSTYENMFYYPSEESNLTVFIPKDHLLKLFDEVSDVGKIPAEVVEGENIENCIYHIKLIDELLKYYRKDDILICNYGYRDKINPEKSPLLLKSSRLRVDDICNPASTISIEICIFPENKNFSFSIIYFFEEGTVQLPRIQFCVSWDLECIQYNHDFLTEHLRLQCRQIQQEYRKNDYIYSELLNTHKISEIAVSFVRINEVLKTFFVNVNIENAKLKKMSNIVWTTLDTFITKKIGSRIESFYGNFENNVLLLYLTGKITKEFEIDVENYSSEDLNTMIKDIEEFVNLKKLRI